MKGQSCTDHNSELNMIRGRPRCDALRTAGNNNDTQFPAPETALWPLLPRTLLQLHCVYTSRLEYTNLSS